jgi:glycerophosphoryl diester phosphodiesterase
LILKGFKTVQIIAHRGSGHAENTLAAFAYALDNGADGIELDVIKTADGDLAICHDEVLNRHVVGANPRRRDLGFIHQKTMAELRRLDAGEGQGFASLRDIFALATQHQARAPLINIEIKGENCWEPAWRQARDFCAATGYPYDRIVFSSFDHAQLLALRRADADAKIGLLFGTTIAGLAAPLRLHPETGGTARRASLTRSYLNAVLPTIRPTSLHPSVRNAAFAAQYAEHHGLDLYVWTSGEKKPDSDGRLPRFAQAQRDNPRAHVITGYPAEFRRFL